MSEQLVFELPHRPALGADDFLVSDCNATAVRLIDAWPDWTSPAHVIVGPAGSGKSHLANVWRLESGARLLPPAALVGTGPEPVAGERALVLEDAERAGAPDSALFHLLNQCRENGVSLLMTARTPPRDWPAALPDLASRLRSLPAVTIGAPDDDLLRAVLVKHFADRQLDVAPRVITYLAARMERSMEAAARLAAALDRAALASGRKITRRLAGEVLAETDGRGQDG